MGHHAALDKAQERQRQRGSAEGIGPVGGAERLFGGEIAAKQQTPR